MEPSEKVIWRGKPDKKAFVLPELWLILFASFLLTFSILLISQGLPNSEAILIIFGGFGVGINIAYIFDGLRKFPNEEYMITNQRFLIKEGNSKNDIWYVELKRIAEVIVKRRFIDRLFGTGRIYPITPDYPYSPSILGRGIHFYDLDRPKKIFNIEKKTEEYIRDDEVFLKASQHPNFKGIKSPYQVERILKERIS